jgi:hypothetical protein
VQWWYLHNRRVHNQEVERLLAFARAEDPHHPHLPHPKSGTDHDYPREKP